MSSLSPAVLSQIRGSRVWFRAYEQTLDDSLTGSPEPRTSLHAVAVTRKWIRSACDMQVLEACSTLPDMTMLERQAGKKHIA